MHSGVLFALICCALVAICAGPAEARRATLVIGNTEYEDVRAKAERRRLVQAEQADESAATAKQAPPFGTPNVVFAVGAWRIMKLSQESREIYLWTDNGDRAIQVTLDSNGWWGLRRLSDEKVVWSAGNTGVGSFYERPWLRAEGAVFPISAVAYEGRGTHGTTSFEVANDQIRITLVDRGEIQLDTRTRRIIFRNNRGETVTF